MPADKSLKDLSGAVVKIAESYPKIQKDVKDIRDAICGTEGILEAINAISERLDKDHKKEQLRRLTGRQRVSELNNRKLLNNTSSINKTLNKIFAQMKTMSGKGGLTSAKMTRLGAENFRRPERDTRIKHLEGISRSVDIIERLRGLKVKDFIFAKKKLKNIGKIMYKSLTMFRMFKNQKEVDGTLSFVESSIDIVKKLGKVVILSKPAQLGENAIEKIFLGKKGEGGLLRLFRKFRHHKKDIDVGKKSLGKIAKACGSMLLTSMTLAGIAIVGIPAMAGAVLMKGIIWLLLGSFKMLRKANKSVIKGSAVLLLMSASIITFGLGLGLMAKAVKDMKLKDVGLMVASLAGMGLAIAGIGLIAVPIAIGSATLLLMSASLGVFGLALHAWKSIDVKESMGNIKLAVEGLRDTFGLELGKGDGNKNAFQRLGGGVLDIAMGVLNFGKSFFIMGSILLAGAALGLLYHGLKNWDNFNGTKAAGNIKTAVGALKEAFGIGETKEGLGGKLGKLFGGPLDIGISLLQGGKAIAEMGLITIATGLSDTLRLFLIPWNKFDARPAANNLKIAVSALKDAFGLEDKNTTTSKLGKFVGSILDMGTSLMNAGGVLGKMGTISIATGIADIIKLKLKPWENYNATPAIENMGLVVSSLVKLFGLEDKGNSPFGKLGNLAGSFFDVGSTLLKSGGVLAKMGTISLATGMLDKIKENLISWGNFDAGHPIANVKVAIDSLLDVFGLNKIRREADDTVENNGFFGRISGSLKKVGNVISDAFNTASSLVETASDLASGGKVMAKMSNILHATSAMFSIKGALEPWDNYNSTQAITSIGDAVKGINRLFTEITSVRNLEPKGIRLSNSQYFEVSTASIKKGITNLANSWRTSEILKSAEIPFKKSIDAVNALDISKASTMIDMFKSFSNINKKPFDKFTNAVNKFAESSGDLIDALNNFNSNYNIETNTSGIGSGESTINKVEGVNINNPQALATAIADAIKSLPINIENSVSDIRLVVNGDAGRRVILTLED